MGDDRRTESSQKLKERRYTMICYRSTSREIREGRGSGYVAHDACSTVHSRSKLSPFKRENSVLYYIQSDSLNDGII